MKSNKISIAVEPDIVLLRPGDIVILVTAARGTAGLMSNATVLGLTPADCEAAISSATSLRINRLIMQLDKCILADNEIRVEMVFGDRQFFAEVLCAYHGHAKDSVWARGWDSITMEEATARRKAISERYADIFTRLGGSGWKFDEGF